MHTRVRHIASPPRTEPPPDKPLFAPVVVKPRMVPDGVHLDVRHFGTYNAYVLTVSDPRLVSVVATQYMGNVGETVEQFVDDHHAVVGINGGSFTDTNWQGTGGQVQGIVISDGKVVASATHPESIIGFTHTGKLISGTYTLAQLKAMGVTQALMFGPTLVQNGVGQIQGAAIGVMLLVPP
nr:phosphodiester glycosidase family protein [Alicyclobacillus sacchari]